MVVIYNTSLDDSMIACDWQSLPQDALVVDVGGGVGTVSLVLARRLGNLKIVIQDRAQVIEDGVNVSSSLSRISTHVLLYYRFGIRISPRLFQQVGSNSKVGCIDELKFLPRCINFPRHSTQLL